MFRILLRRRMGSWEDSVMGDPPSEARRIAARLLDRFMEHKLVTIDLRPHAVMVYRRRLLASVSLVEVDPEIVVRAVDLGISRACSGEVPAVVSSDPPRASPLRRLWEWASDYRAAPVPDGSLLGDGWSVHGALAAAESGERVEPVIRRAVRERVHYQWDAFDRRWERL